MAVGDIARLRSVALVGQGGTGKTQLADALLNLGRLPHDERIADAVNVTLRIAPALRRKRRRPCQRLEDRRTCKVIGKRSDSHQSHQDCAGKVLAIRDGNWNRTRSGRRIGATRTQSFDALDFNDQCR